MTPNKYQLEAIQTEPSHGAYEEAAERAKPLIRLEHAAKGLATEAGEFVDQLKKHIYYGAPLDLRNLKEEIGDILWYVAIACDALDYPMEQAMIDNIEKLRKRFPEKFNQQDAVVRNTEAEVDHIE